jgi:hypothetical protein
VAKRSKVKTEEKQFIEWLNATVSIFPVAADYHVIPRGDMERDSQVYCPFHANVDTPSARIYTETNNLHCFSCSRDYGVYDFLTTLGGMSHMDVLQLYGKDYEGHVRENIENHKLESQRSVLEAAASDVDSRRRLSDFQAQMLSDLVAGDAYAAWRPRTKWTAFSPTRFQAIIGSRFSGGLSERHHHAGRRYRRAE